MILTALSNAPGAQLLTLANDGVSDTGYTLLDGADFGTPTYEHTFSGARGTQGARPAQGKLPNRQVQLPFRVAGATKDELAQRVSALVTVVDELRRYGGAVRMRSKAQTYAQTFDVLTAELASGGEWSNRVEHRYLQLLGLRLVCGPYLLGDPMDLVETFDVDSINGSDPFYTARIGSLADLTVAGGIVTGAGTLTTERRLTWTRSGYTFGDHEVTVEGAPGATITSFALRAILAEVATTTYLDVYVDDNGTNSRLRIDKVVAGVRTNLGSTNLAARVVAGRKLTVRGRIEGNVVFAEHFLDTLIPDPTVAPTTSLTYTLTTAEAAVFGEPVEGRAGFSFTPQHAAAYVDRVEILPFTYRNPPLDTLDCFGRIPGDAPALGTVRMTPQIVGQSFGMFAWAGRPRIVNMVEHGDFDVSAFNAALRWATPAVTGVLANAGTSVAAVSATTPGYGARSGDKMLQIVTPATANSGATYVMRKRFRKGSTYRLRLWVRSSTGTTLVRARLGVNGDIASSTAAALTTGWVQHVVDWTPTADQTVAYIAVEVTAATATTFQVDEVVLTRGTADPTYGSHPRGGGAPPPLAVLRAENYVEGQDGNLTLTAVTNAVDTNALQAASVPALGQSYSIYQVIDVGTLPGEDYTQNGSVSVEVWARVMGSQSFTGGVTAIVQALAFNRVGAILYTHEFGSTGTRLESLATGGHGQWRFLRLGMLDLPAQGNDSRFTLAVTFVVAAGTNLQAFAVDHLVVVPARSRFASPTGKPWSTGYSYPSFAGGGNLGAGRIVNPDLTSVVYVPNGAQGAGGGIGGAPCELPTGLFSFLALTSNRPPDDPEPYLPGFSELQASPSVHVGVRPRWHYLRT